MVGNSRTSPNELYKFMHCPTGARSKPGGFGCVACPQYSVRSKVMDVCYECPEHQHQRAEPEPFDNHFDARSRTPRFDSRLPTGIYPGFRLRVLYSIGMPEPAWNMALVDS